MTQLSTDAVIPIKYVGKKKEKHDTINHTGTIWQPGQTLFYPARIARPLLLHPDVWRLGRKEDVDAEQAVMGQAIAAAENETHPNSDAKPLEGSGAHPADPVLQSELTKDRSRGTGGARATLE